MARENQNPYIELLKPGILMHSMMTMTLGYVLASYGAPFNWLRFIFAFIGISMASGGAAALNHFLERKVDLLMDRTATRPLPAKKISPVQALVYALVLLAGGIALLVFKVNVLTAALCAVTAVLYDFVYTPLKRITWLNTFVGGIPGAVPVLCGWTSATGHVHQTAWVFFLIFYFWQMPHFFAIAWMHKDSYKNAGFKMLTLYDPNGRVTALNAIAYIVVMAAITVIPFLTGLMGLLYLTGIMFLNVGFLIFAVYFLKDCSYYRARNLMLFSLLYPPGLTLLVFCDLFW